MDQNEPSVNDLLQEAEEARENKDYPKAVKLFKQVLKIDNMKVAAYNSLMKIYRKEKDYENELSIISKGIKVFENYYKKHSGKHNKKIDLISAKLNKSLGLVDKKGNKLYNPEPIATWEKRMATVMKRIEKDK